MAQALLENNLVCEPLCSRSRELSIRCASTSTPTTSAAQTPLPAPQSRPDRYPRQYPTTLKGDAFLISRFVGRQVTEAVSPHPLQGNVEIGVVLSGGHGVTLVDAVEWWRCAGGSNFVVRQTGFTFHRYVAECQCITV